MSQPNHPSHQTRSSDSSIYDEKCVYCCATDAPGSTALERPCPSAPGTKKLQFDCPHCGEKDTHITRHRSAALLSTAEVLLTGSKAEISHGEEDSVATDGYVKYECGDCGDSILDGVTDSDEELVAFLRQLPCNADPAETAPAYPVFKQEQECVPYDPPGAEVIKPRLLDLMKAYEKEHRSIPLRVHLSRDDCRQLCRNIASGAIYTIEPVRLHALRCVVHPQADLREMIGIMLLGMRIEAVDAEETHLS